MADDALVLSNLLCFLTSKYGKCTIKVLKSAVFDFYSDKDIKLLSCQNSSVIRSAFDGFG